MSLRTFVLAIATGIAAFVPTYRVARRIRRARRALHQLYAEHTR